MGGLTAVAVTPQTATIVAAALAALVAVGGNRWSRTSSMFTENRQMRAELAAKDDQLFSARQEILTLRSQLDQRDGRIAILQEEVAKWKRSAD